MNLIICRKNLLKKTKKLTFFLTVLLFLGSISFAKSAELDYSAAIAIAEKTISKAINEEMATGATVSFTVDGAAVYSKTFGTIEKDSSTAINQNTQFNIASVSKVFTAVAILQLVDQGKLSLDDPVVDHLPAFTMPLDSRHSDITVRMLLDHSSGLPGTNFYNFATTKPDNTYIPDTLSYLKDNVLKSNPGNINVYCNDGFALAEAVIATVSDEGSYAGFLQKNIFTPLNLERTSVNFITGDTNRAHHNYLTEFLNNKATGGIASTAKDLCTFGNNIFNGKILSADSIRELRKSQVAEDSTLGLTNPLFNCGLGWDVVAVGDFEAQGVQVFAKNGGSLDFNSQIYVAPDHNISIAIVYSGGPVEPIQKTCNNIMQSILETKGVVTPPSDLKNPVTDASLPSKFSSKYRGIYAGGDDTFKVDFNNETNEMDFFAFSDGSFTQAGTGKYKSDGYFHIESTRFQFITYSNKNFLVKVINSGSDKILIHSEQITAIDNGLSSSKFDNKTWFQRNIKPDDIIAHGIIKTGELTDIDDSRLNGYVHIFDVAYKLTDERTTENVLRYGRDTYGAKVIAHDTLKWGMFEFNSFTSVDTLNTATNVTVNDNEDNQWYKASNNGHLTSPLSSNTRILVYDSSYEMKYDSLIGNQSSASVDINTGDYICFVGTAQTTFAITWNPTVE